MLLACTSSDWWDLLWAWIKLHDALTVSVLAVIAAVAIPIWQVRHTLKQQKQSSLTEQRWEIYLALNDLIWYYFTQSNPEFPDLGSFYNPAKSMEKIRGLLGRPTLMKEDEIKEIYQVVSTVRASENPEKLGNAARALRLKLESKLRPELTRIAHEVIWENAAKRAKEKEKRT
jgi:hypothetical protein